MSAVANPARGEAAITVAGQPLVLRPTFAALVAAEEELGPLFGLIERAGAGKFSLTEVAALFWHCLADRPEGIDRATLGNALVEAGLAAVTPILRQLLGQVLKGR